MKDKKEQQNEEQLEQIRSIMVLWKLKLAPLRIIKKNNGVKIILGNIKEPNPNGKVVPPNSPITLVRALPAIDKSKSDFKANRNHYRYFMESKDGGIVNIVTNFPMRRFKPE